MKNVIGLLGIIFLWIMIWTQSAGAENLGGLDVHGYLSQGYMKSSDNNYLAPTEDGTFEFNEMGLNFSIEFDKLRFGAQFLSKDLGEFGNNKVVLDWAMGDYQFDESFGVHAGKIKIPMGLYNQGRDVDLLRVPVLLPGSIYDEGTRDMLNAYEGVGVHGLFDSVVGELDYELYYGTVDVDKDSIYIKGNQEEFGRQIPGSTVSNAINSTKYVTGGGLRWSPPLDGLRVGYSYTLAETTLKADVTADILEFLVGSRSAVLTVKVDKYEIWVASLEYTWHNLCVAGEYSNTNIDLTPNLSGVGFPEQNYPYEGWYVQTTYRFTDWLVAGIYYSEWYPNRDDKDGSEQIKNNKPDYFGWQKDVTASLRFDITYNWIVKAEAHFIDGAGQVYIYNNPEGIDQNWNLYLLKTTYSF